MSKKVALVGHCGPDGSYLRVAVGAVEKGIQVVMADDEDDLRKVLNNGGVDLLLINRMLDYGFSEQEGVAFIRTLRLAYPNLKMMLVSNYPEAQAAAIAAGALPGFGKRDLGNAKTRTLLREALLGPEIAASKPDASHP